MTKTVHRIAWDDAYLAAAQRAMIAQNWFFRHIYLTWWTWWLPRVGIVGIVGWLAETGVKFDWSFYAFIAGFLLLTFFGEYWGRRSLARARARNRSRGSTTMVTMSDEGIEIVGALGSSRLKWKAPRSISVKPDGVLLMHSNLSGLWLPDSALAEGTRDDVRQLVSVNRSS
jgi:YcxB-like protein